MQLDVQVNIQYTLYIVRFVNNNNNNTSLYTDGLHHHKCFLVELCVEKINKCRIKTKR